MPRPYHIISFNDPVYTGDALTTADRSHAGASSPLFSFSLGKMALADEPPIIDDDGKIDAKSLRDAPFVQAAKDFSLNYVTKAIARSVEHMLEAGHGTSDVTNSFFKMKNLLTDRAKALPDALERSYAEHGAAGADERYAIIQRFVENRIEKSLRHFCTEGYEKHTKNLSRIVADNQIRDHQENLATQFIFSGGEKRLGDAFSRLPEWVQVLAHDDGFLVYLNSDPKSNRMVEGTALVRFDLQSIYLNPKTFSKKDPKSSIEQVAVLREELLHLYEGIAYTVDPSLHERWAKAADAFIPQLDMHPEHPALQLIKQTEPGGGSLMGSKDRDARRSELLVDVFEVEIHLRQSGMDRTEAEQAVKKAFGDEVFSASRQFLDIWIQQAAGLLEDKERDRYAQKWRDDPLCHTNTLQHHPKFQLNGGAPDYPDH